MKTETARNLEQYIDHNVVDQNDKKIGTLQCLWSDQNGEPAYLGVQTGWLFGKTHVVPADSAKVNPAARTIRLPYNEEKIKDAPSYDSALELDSRTQTEVMSYYNISASQSRAGQQNQNQNQASASSRSGQTTKQDAATVALHEEQVKIGKRQVEAGGIRLRKVIRTETTNQPVELQREELVIERVPGGQVTSKGDCADGSFQEQEIFIPLRREEAVVQKETHVREQVKVSKKSETERQTVSQQVRKEDVQIEKTGAAGRQSNAPRSGQQNQPSRTTGQTSQTGSRSVFGLCRNESQASQAVQNLKQAGFSKDDISVLFADKKGTKDFAHEKNTKAPEGATTGAGTGGILGGAFGWLAGIGALAIPGVGPFIAAGPIMAALSGAAIGAAAGGIAGALIGMGIPEYEAKRYEGKVKEGNVLISVHSDSADETRKAKDILEKAGAEDISSSGEAAVSDKRSAAYTK